MSVIVFNYSLNSNNIKVEFIRYSRSVVLKIKDYSIVLHTVYNVVEYTQKLNLLTRKLTNSSKQQEALNNFIINKLITINGV